MTAPNSRKKEDEAKREQRRADVARLVLAGVTYRDIAAQLHTTLTTVARDMDVVQERWRSEQVTAIADKREQEVRRIDQVLMAVYPLAIAGSLDAVDRFIKLSKRRSELLGLDMPTKVAPTNADGTAPYDPLAALSEFDALLGQLAERMTSPELGAHPPEPPVQEGLYEPVNGHAVTRPAAGDTAP